MKQGDVQTSTVFTSAAAPPPRANRSAIILGQKTIRNRIKLIQCRATLAPRKVTKLSGSHEKCCLLAFAQVCVCACVCVGTQSNYERQGWSKLSKGGKKDTQRGHKRKQDKKQGKRNPPEVTTNSRQMHSFYMFGFAYVFHYELL